MKNYSKILMLAVLLSLSVDLFAQYCTPPAWASGPYTGITNVTLGSLNNSSTINDGGSGVYTYWTSVKVPTLKVSTQYPISVTTQIIGSGNNSRVWIDWNQDQDFDDAGEEVCAWSSQPQGKLTANFTVPSSALAGTTRMRVYTDMNESQGHISPEPCGYLNHSGHALMQHGEVEDYDVTISTTTGISGNNIENLDLTFDFSNQQVIINYRLPENAWVTLDVYNLIGKQFIPSFTKFQNKGNYQIALNKNSLHNSSDFLIVRITSNQQTLTKKLLVQ